MGAKMILDDPSHPRHYKLKRKYDAKDPKCLWLAPMVTMATSPKRTVRVWLRAALREEMEARGLNELGQRMRDGKATEGPAAVWGTLVLNVNEKMISARYEQVRKEAGWTADALLAGFRPQGSRPQGSSPPPKPQPKPKPRPSDGKGTKNLVLDKGKPRRPRPNYP
ncbi:hypothetical protein SLS58_007821 [Diplodia intermedia]|uniref:Uncharacterized protein n=1 Tax=Diplodia intermedia TaxID=856260 RepID=A0ABR3TIZ4_9PEZI